MSEDDYEKLKEALHALAAMLVQPRSTEKTSAVLGKPTIPLLFFRSRPSIRGMEGSR